MAFTAGQLPKIFPVNHWVDRHTIVFRTAWASSLQLKAGAPVAFEADDTDEMRKIGWSVLVEGRLSAVTDPVEADALDARHSESWAPGIRDYLDADRADVDHRPCHHPRPRRSRQDIGPWDGLGRGGMMEP